MSAGASVAASALTAAKEAETVVSPGVAGFLVTFVLALATVLLIRSMVKHLRKVRYGPGPDDADAEDRAVTDRGPDDT